MNYCSHCGNELKSTGVATEKTVVEKFVSIKSEKALNSVLAKLHEIAPRFDDMSEEEWGEWVNSLEPPEFIELLTLGNEGIGKAIRNSLG